MIVSLTSIVTPWTEWCCTRNFSIKFPTHVSSKLSPINSPSWSLKYNLEHQKCWSNVSSVSWIIFLSNHRCSTKSTKFVNHMEVPCTWFKVMKVNRYRLIKFCGFAKPHSRLGCKFLNCLQFSHCDTASIIILAHFSVK